MAEQGFKLDVRTNIDELVRNLGIFQRDQIPFVTAYALTKTAQDIKQAEVEKMSEVFDRPTRFTLNALFVKTANKRNLTAAVLFKEGNSSIPAWRYLGPQVEGGPRVKKSHERRLERAGILRPEEFVVPASGVRLDAYGNMKGGDIERILSQLGAAEQWAGYQANMTARSRKRNIRRAGGQYIVVRGKQAPDGIYQRKGANRVVPVMIFVRQPIYNKRFPFHETAASTFERSFARHFRAGYRNYVRRGHHPG